MTTEEVRRYNTSYVLNATPYVLVDPAFLFRIIVERTFLPEVRLDRSRRAIASLPQTTEPAS